MKLLISLIMFIAFSLTTAELNVANQESTQPNTQLSANGVAVDEVVVESSLFIKPKQRRTQLSRVRRSILSDFDIFKALVERRRVKRQLEQYGKSQTTANATAHINYNNNYDCGSSAANAQAQVFNTQEPGGFGASTAASVTQVLNQNRYAGVSNALIFNLPSDQSVNFDSANNADDSRDSVVSVNRI